MLRRIKEDAEKYLKEPVEEAIISVSAGMDDAARLAVKRAGALAGLKVEQLMNEASAAALEQWFLINFCFMGDLTIHSQSLCRKSIYLYQKGTDGACPRHTKLKEP